MRGREGEEEGREEGEEGAGGGRGEEKREGGEKRIFFAREARAAPEGRRETRGREGEVRVGGGRGIPPCPPPLTCPLSQFYRIVVPFSVMPLIYFFKLLQFEGIYIIL